MAYNPGLGKDLSWEWEIRCEEGRWLEGERHAKYIGKCLAKGITFNKSKLYCQQTKCQKEKVALKQCFLGADEQYY